MSLRWKGALGIGLSALLIWWTLSGVPFSDVWAIVRTGNFWLLGASVLVATSGFAIRALRWHILLQPVKRDTTFSSRFGAVTIGFMANNLLPARVGEFVRAYALGRAEAVSVSGAFGSLVVERFLDGLVLMAFFVIPMTLPGFPASETLDQGTATAILRGMVGVLAVLLTTFAVLLAWPKHVARILERVLSLLPGDLARRGVGAIEAFLGSLQVLRRPALLIPAVLWSLGFWTWHGFSFYLGMAAFGINEGFLAAIFTEAAVGFGVALPSAPGFFGTFHFAADWALSSVYGVEQARSLAFAYGYHLGGFFPVTFIGLWYARRLGISMGDMRGSEERVEAAVEAAHPEGFGSGEVNEPKAEAARSVELDAPAKVNLFLRVLEREPSGYHGIETLFQTLDLADRVRVTLAPGDSVQLDVSGLDAGPPQQNLVLRAARAFLDAAGETHGLTIELDKRIPAGTGLGGASSDAAATLRALDRLFPGSVNAGHLIQIAEGLGSDVPFFLCGSALAQGLGRGEILVPLSPLPHVPVILAFPNLHISTAEAYQRLDRDRAETAWQTQGPTPALDAPDWPSVARLRGNDFEASVFSGHPEVEQARDALQATEPLFVSLSGSGSAVFAVYTDEGKARSAFAQLGNEVDSNFVLTRTRRSVPPIKLL